MRNKGREDTKNYELYEDREEEWKSERVITHKNYREKKQEREEVESPKIWIEVKKGLFGEAGIIRKLPFVENEDASLKLSLPDMVHMMEMP